MISYLELENYRGFRKYKLAGLTRVNLLVGKNNSGKTSLLEAVRLLASGGDVWVISRIARQRGELLYSQEDQDATVFIYPDVSHLFYNRNFNVYSRLSLRSDGDHGKLVVYVVNVWDVPENVQRSDIDDNKDRSYLGLATRIESDTPPHKTGRVIPVSEEGAVYLDRAFRSGRINRTKADQGVVQFVSQDSLERGSMSEMWNKVIIEGKEQDVVNAMRILEPKLSSIAFLSSQQSARYEPRGGILVGFEGSQRRYPLGSYGEGMRRLLALSLSLASAQEGILLIDEVDTGLHYSIIGDMWLLIVETAKRYNIQSVCDHP